VSVAAGEDEVEACAGQALEAGRAVHGLSVEPRLQSVPGYGCIVVP
jgi:hypothetical protein